MSIKNRSKFISGTLSGGRPPRVHSLRSCTHGYLEESLSGTWDGMGYRVFSEGAFALLMYPRLLRGVPFGDVGDTVIEMSPFQGQKDRSEFLS